jgi:hypothetical protein
MSVEATPGPGLSRLPYETRVRIAVAETQGATWTRNEQLLWWELRGPSPICGIPELPLLCTVPDLGYGTAEWRGGNYLTDPAAWGPVAIRERIALVPSEDGWYAVSPEDVEHGYVRGTAVSTVTIHWPEHAEREAHGKPGAAVCAAVLAKHGRTVAAPLEADTLPPADLPTVDEIVGILNQEDPNDVAT